MLDAVRRKIKTVFLSMPIIKAMHLQIEIKLTFKAGLGVAQS